MNKLDILLKCLLLAIKQYDLNTLTDSSNESVNYNDLIIEIVENLENSNKNKMKNLEHSIVDDVEHLLLEIIKDLDNIDKDLIIQTLETIMRDNPRLLRSIVSSIKEKEDVESLKRTINNISKFLNNYLKKKQLLDKLNKAYFELQNNKFNLADTNKYINNLLADLETLSTSNENDDPAILDELDLDDETAMETAMEKAENEILGATVLKTGWQDLNIMTQKGIRRGEFVTIAALQHKYKTGFTLSLFAQLARLNKPILDDPNKKPLMILYSLEDSMSNVINFLYRYLWFNKYKELPKLSESTAKEKAKFIRDEMTVSGYNVKILKVNPSEWSYRQLFKSIIGFESQGYEIHSVFIDYVSLIPTIGCIKTGPTGTDMRDLFRRIRNFASA